MDTFLGMPIEVDLHWFWIAQFFGILTIVFDFVSYQIKNQRRYLLWFSVGSFWWMLMFLSLEMGGAQMISPILAAAFSVLRGMVFWWIFAKDTPGRKRGGKIFLYVALAIGLGGAVLGIVNTDASVRYLHIIMLVTALLFVVGQYLPSKHYVRAFAILYATSMLLIATPLDTFNPMGIIIEAAKIISIIVFYCLMVRRSYYVKKLKEIKAIIADEVTKINVASDAGEVANIMPQEKLEAIVAKMIKYELSAIDKSNLVNLKSIEEETKAVLEDIKTVQDVKDLIQGVIDVKQEKMEKIPVRAMQTK
ncbi:MAG: hypothetical protein FWE16_05030 [Firmicutes bacterium]|nr:hypothetical protein [Bacillota bacterium]